jgi:uncharacterized protein DUF2019
LLRNSPHSGVEQDKAEQADDIAKVNCLFRRMIEIQKELKTRPGDQRSALTILFEYPNMQVRLQVARAILAVAPQAARRLVETIAASNWPPQCYHANMWLWALDNGTLCPSKSIPQGSRHIAARLRRTSRRQTKGYFRQQDRITRKYRSNPDAEAFGNQRVVVA